MANISASLTLVWVLRREGREHYLRSHLIGLLCSKKKEEDHCVQLRKCVTASSRSDGYC